MFSSAGRVIVAVAGVFIGYKVVAFIQRHQEKDEALLKEESRKK